MAVHCDGSVCAVHRVRASLCGCSLCFMVVHCNDSVNGARRVAWLRTSLCSAGHYDVSVRAVRRVVVHRAVVL